MNGKSICSPCSGTGCSICSGTGEVWDDIQDLEEAELESMHDLRHDELDTDCNGQCYSDADPGL